MKSIGLQLVTVVLENGQEGIFVGVPLVAEDNLGGEGNQVEEIWFSSVQELPNQLTLVKLMRMLGEQLSRCRATLQ